MVHAWPKGEPQVRDGGMVITICDSDPERLAEAREVLAGSLHRPRLFNSFVLTVQDLALEDIKRIFRDGHLVYSPTTGLELEGGHALKLLADLVMASHPDGTSDGVEIHEWSSWRGKDHILIGRLSGPHTLRVTSKIVGI